MGLKEQTLIWGEDPGLSSGPSLIRQVLKGRLPSCGHREIQQQKKGQGAAALPALMMKGRAMSQGKLEKSKEQDSPLESPGRNAALLTP